MEEQELKAINFLQVKNVSNKPCMILYGDYLFDTEFLPGERLMVKVYKGKLVITQATAKELEQEG